MANPRKVTLGDISERVGVTRMAVSLALRNKPGVSEDTRKKVLRAAEDTGYEPDPVVSKLMSHIRSSRPMETKACIGLLTAGPAARECDVSLTERKYVSGVVERARLYGYCVEEFHIGPDGLSPARAESVLWSRGIEGVVLRPLQFGISSLESRTISFPFERFSSVAISETITTPDLDRALHDQYTAMLTTIEEITKLGYKRIGLVVQQALNMRVNGRWSAAFLQFQLFPGSQKQPPPLILDELRPAKFLQWFRRYKPDVIVSVDRFGLRLIEEHGLDIPGDVGYVSLDLDGERPEHSSMTGIDQNSELVGAAAVDMLIVSIHKKQRGIPLHPLRLEVEGEWKNGTTTRIIAS